MIPQWAKIPTLIIVVGWDPWSKKRVNYFSYIEGKGGGKDIHCSAQNSALFVDLLYNIFSYFTLLSPPSSPTPQPTIYVLFRTPSFAKIFAKV